MRLGLHFLCGGLAVYAAMAACAGADGESSLGGGGSSGGATAPIPTASAAEPTGGKRLKAITIVSEDGARQFLGWHDTERDEDCAFRTASDGKWRCLPATTSAAYFADAACTVPAAQFFATDQGCVGAVPVPASVYVAEACTGELKRYAVAGEPAAKLFGKSTDGTCVDLTSTVGSVVTTRALSAPEPIEAAAFVAGSMILD